MNLHFELHAQQELDDAVAYYDGVSMRLGSHFIEEVERVISQILISPRLVRVVTFNQTLSHKAISLRGYLPRWER